MLKDSVISRASLHKLWFNKAPALVGTLMRFWATRRQEAACSASGSSRVLCVTLLQ